MSSPRPPMPNGRPGEVRFDSFTDASPHAGFGSSNPGSGTASPFTPSDSSKDAESASQLLRRLSLKEVLTMRAPDFQEQYPSLNLSGRIISTAFCIPHKLYFRTGCDWELKPRPGSSALFHSFAFLASEKSGWDHTLVGWTGEVEPLHEESSQSQPLRTDANTKVPTTLDNNARAFNKGSAPIVPDASKLHSNSVLTETFAVGPDDRKRLEKQLSSTRYGKIAPVWLTEESEVPEDTLHLHDQGRWRRYAEKELYALLHYKQHGPTDGRFERDAWADYLRMNRLFADRIIQEYQEGDIVWIHDYHLFLLPSILRQHLPNVHIAFYLHSPFPSSEFMRCLAKRKEILTGVLGANMIGFQTFSYSRHFSSCCTRVLGFESNSAGVDAYGAHVAVDVFPIGIDAEAIQKSAFGNADTEKAVAGLRKLYAGKKIIVGRDRLDSARGVAQKLQAFETFLERFPEWRDKVVLIQVTSPTSVEEEKEEHKIASRISNLVDTINGHYGSLSFSPVKYYPQYLFPHEYFALLRVADVGLITTVRDGMNTTSLEYIVCQQGNCSPLILSEFSGTAGALSSAIHINPWDTIGVAESINKALTMPAAEKEEQHSKLYKHVTTNTVSAWSNHFVYRLLTNLSSFDQSVATPALDKTKLLKQYRKSRKRLFMFDYDGTLTPIVKDPQSAIPSDRVLRTLKSLAADPRNAVWIISGRDQAFLDEWMGHIPELGLSAEHGCFIRMPRSDNWQNLAETTDMGWQKEVMEIYQHYTERTQGSFIERKKVALTWHYRRADPEYGAFQARECRKQLEEQVSKNWDVEVMAGKANLEVRPRFVNKGFIATRLVEAYDNGKVPEFILCSGDDFTDEDMFRALKKFELPVEHVYTVTVGASSKQTEAGWHLLEPSDVIETVTMLNSSSSGQDHQT